jgi:hypothetical protein
MVPHLPVYDLALLLIPTLVILDRVLVRPLQEYLSSRLALVALVIFTALSDEWARQTHFQVVVPLTTWIWWQAQNLLYENQGTV